MIKPLIIIILLVFSLGVKSQIKHDTIDYNTFLTKSNFILRKIIQGKDLWLQRGDIYLGSGIITSTEEFQGKFSNGKSTPINVGDTIMHIGWYLIKGGGYCLSGIINHAVGKITLNKNLNTIKAELLKPTYNKLEIEKRTIFLKIIKWTSYEIILEDMLNPEKHRRYYFTKT